MEVVPQSLTFTQRWEAYVAQKSGFPSICIVTPVIGHQVNVLYTQSLMETTLMFHKMGIPCRVEFSNGPQARNTLIAKAMSDPECTHVMCIDSDIGWSPIEILKLIMHETDMVAGLVPGKGYGFEKWFQTAPIIPQQGQGETLVEVNPTLFEAIRRYHSSTFAQSVPFPTYMARNLVNYEVAFASNEIKRNVIPVTTVSSGFMLLTRSAIEKWIAHFPIRKFDKPGDPTVTEAMKPFLYTYYQQAVVDGTLYSEEAAFCHDWRTVVDGTIGVDVSVSLIHSGTSDTEGNYLHCIL
jgi:hypothetical protein